MGTRHLENQANSRYKTGKTNYQDVIKVRIRKKLLVENLQTLKEQQKNLEFRIRELLNLPHSIPVGNPKPIKANTRIMDINLIIEKAFVKRQELRIIKENIVKMKKMIELAESQIYPSYNTDFSFFSNNAINSIGAFAKKSNFSTDHSLTMGAGIPKNAWFGMNDAYLRQTKQKLMALKSDLAKAKSKTSTLISNAWFNLDRDIREANLYKKEIVSLAKSALDISSRGYETGTVLFADVIDSYMNWLNINISLEQKHSNIGISRANLIKTVGGQYE